MNTERSLAEDFLTKSAELLHRHGTPAHRQERLLMRMAKALNLEAQFLVTPTSLLFAFGGGPAQRTRMLRVEPGGVNLGKLVELDELLEQVEHERLSIAEANQQLDRLAQGGARYPGWLACIATGFACAGAAVLFGGSNLDVLVTLLLSGSLDALSRVAFPRIVGSDRARLLELTLAAAIAFFASALTNYLPLSAEVITLASLIVLVPGLTLTVAMIELATHHLVAGTARFFGALTTFLTIAFGVGLGRAGASLLAGEPTTQQAASNLPYLEIAAIALSPVAFAILFQARWRELPWIFFACVGGLLGSRVGTESLSPELGSCVGALIVGLVANLFARIKDRPASVPLTPAILLLVPGAIGFRAIDLFLARDVVAGMENAFRVAMVATSLVGGLLVANVLLPPRRSL